MATQVSGEAVAAVARAVRRHWMTPKEEVARLEETPYYRGYRRQEPLSVLAGNANRRRRERKRVA